jgi:hypothetical protein
MKKTIKVMVAGAVLLCLLNIKNVVSKAGPIKYPLPPYATVQDSSGQDDAGPIKKPYPPLPPYATVQDSSGQDDAGPIKKPYPPLPPKA